MDELMNNNYVSFLFYEKNKECIITIYNDQKILMKKIVSEEEGKEQLVTYCLSQRSLELEPHIDTICLKNGSDKIRGFIRYMEEPEVIREQIIDLFYNSIIPKFICDFLEILQLNAKNIKISSRLDHNSNPEINIYGENEKNFHMAFQMDRKKYFSYIISEYRKRHENINVKELKEDCGQIVLDGIEFPIELLDKEQREFFTSKIRENNNASFVQFLDSPFGQKLNQSLESQDSMQLVRIKPDMPE